MMTLYLPDEKALCLFGLPDGTWEVSQLPEEVPVQLPEPVCGINFARDVTPKKVWLSMIAIHSDAWLMSIAFYHAGRVSFDRVGRYAAFLYCKCYISPFLLQSSFFFKQDILCVECIA